MGSVFWELKGHTGVITNEIIPIITKKQIKSLDLKNLKGQLRFLL